uniref:CSON015078 protein n=1 Tax=Culicoides sonorensis TaxID=179676 RepID=A0A336MGV0_CULSO
MSDREDGEIEDGEIEDDEEMSVDPIPVQPESSPVKLQGTPVKNPEKIDKRSNSVEDDWASNVEKAMANALIKAGVEPPLPNISAKDDDVQIIEDSSESKKRKRSKRKPASERKKKKKENAETNSSRVELFDAKRPKLEEDGVEEFDDEYEMLNMRGGSPPPPSSTIVDDHKQPPQQASSDDDSYDSDEYRKMSYEERRQRRREQNRQNRRDRSMERDRDDRRRRERERDRRDYDKDRNDRNDDHHREPRKMEICKFYLLDCCAKRDKCSYLHSEYPCKYYYLGMKCPTKDCKFNHGKPLTDQFRGILLKHLETAPKEILGDFPRIGREKALKLMDAQHLKLLAKERNEKDPEGTLSNTPNIPSLLDGILPKHSSSSSNNNENRPRRSRWVDVPVPPAPTLPEPESKKKTIPDYMSIKNMLGILTSKQIDGLLAQGIESVEQINELTLAQLNKLELTISQITEMQTNVQTIEKMMKDKKLEDKDNKKSASPSNSLNQDLDLRLGLQINQKDEMPRPLDIKDIDLRLPPPTTNPLVNSLSNVPITGSAALQALETKKVDSDSEPAIDPQKLQTFRSMFGNSSSGPNLVDFSQYLKDAHIKDSESSEANHNDKNDGDDDDENRNEESGNQDEESELQIDETWYSDDDEKDKEKSSEEPKEQNTDKNDTIMSPIHTQESIIATLKELEKAKQKEQEEKQGQKSFTSHHSLDSVYNPATENSFSSFYESGSKSLDKPEKISSDPRTRRISNEIKSPSLSDSADETVITRPSIYDQYSDDDDDDYGNISKKTDKDMRLAPIEQDLNTGDIDLRLPFKPILASLIPATEINGSINSHLPIDYKLHEIDIPKPKFRELKQGKSISSESVNDPRLVRLLGLKSNSSRRDRRDSRSSDYEISTPMSPDPVPAKPAPRLDPRTRKAELSRSSTTTLISSPNSNNTGSNPKDANQLDMPGLMVLLQKSGWYQQLNSNSKISVNQTLARLSGEIKKFNADPSSDKVFDLTFVTSDPILQHILNNLGVYMNENGHFCHVDDSPKAPPPILPNLSQPPPGTLPMPSLPTGINLNTVLNSSLGAMLNQARPGFIAPPPRASLLGMPPPMLPNQFLNESVLGAIRGLLPPPLNVPPPLINDNFNNRNQGNRNQMQQQDRRRNDRNDYNNSRRNNDYRQDPRRNRD